MTAILDSVRTMPGDETDPKEDDEELDKDIVKQAYPLSEGSKPVEIDGRQIARLVLYPHGAQVPENTNELAKLLTKKENDLEKVKKELEKSKQEKEDLDKKLKEIEEKLSKIEETEKTELSKELNEMREKVGLDKIEDEKLKALSLEVMRSKMEDAKDLSKVEKEPGKPKPNLKKELAEGKDKEEKKRVLRKKMFGHDEVPGTEAGE